MKKIIAAVMTLMLLVFTMPFITVLGHETSAEPEPQGTKTQPDNQSDMPDAVMVSSSTYDEKTMITLWDSGQVRSMTMHDYLCGVLAAEMPISFPVEALRAQAVAARTYTLYKMQLYENGTAVPESHHGAQVCSNPAHCKAYIDVVQKASSMWGQNAQQDLGIITLAVTSTNGVVATYQGKPIAAVFHSASSPHTENAKDVWGTAYPYLVSVQSPGGDASKRYNATVTMTQAAFKQKVLAKYPSCNLSGAATTWFKNSKRSEAGGIITVALGGVTVKGTEVRTLLGLNSTNFTYSVEGDNVVFHTTGYGHGVGLSQYGARQLALNGLTYDKIIKWYYSGVDLTVES